MRRRWGFRLTLGNGSPLTSSFPPLPASPLIPPEINVHDEHGCFFAVAWHAHVAMIETNHGHLLMRRNEVLVV